MDPGDYNEERYSLRSEMTSASSLNPDNETEVDRNVNENVDSDIEQDTRSGDAKDDYTFYENFTEFSFVGSEPNKDSNFVCDLHTDVIKEHDGNKKEYSSVSGNSVQHNESSRHYNSPDSFYLKNVNSPSDDTENNLSLTIAVGTNNVQTVTTGMQTMDEDECESSGRGTSELHVFDPSEDDGPFTNTLSPSSVRTEGETGSPITNVSSPRTNPIKTTPQITSTTVDKVSQKRMQIRLPGTMLNRNDINSDNSRMTRRQFPGKKNKLKNENHKWKVPLLPKLAPYQSSKTKDCPFDRNTIYDQDLEEALMKGRKGKTSLPPLKCSPRVSLMPLDTQGEAEKGIIKQQLGRISNKAIFVTDKAVIPSVYTDFFRCESRKKRYVNGMFTEAQKHVGVPDCRKRKWGSDAYCQFCDVVGNRYCSYCLEYKNRHFAWGYESNFFPPIYKGTKGTPPGAFGTYSLPN